jgi:hypothetical protein
LHGEALQPSSGTLSRDIQREFYRKEKGPVNRPFLVELR